MKSQRFEILPRLRQESNGLWTCIWIDPAGVQRRGLPLKGTAYSGVGLTAKEAMSMCRLSYMLRTELDKRRKEEAGKAAEAILASLETPFDVCNGNKIPDHCLATSNLPWWKRLFRV